MRTATRETKTAQSGSFVLRGLLDGEYMVVAGHPDYHDERGTAVVSGDHVVGIEFRFQAGTTLIGRILGVETPDLESLSVAAVGQPAGHDIRRTVVNHKGEFSFKNLVAGEWKLIAQFRDRKARKTLVIEDGVRPLRLSWTLGSQSPSSCCCSLSLPLTQALFQRQTNGMRFTSLLSSP